MVRPGLAKTLHLEMPAVPVTVVTVPLASGLTEQRADGTVAAIAADVAATVGFSEVSYDEQVPGGCRCCRAVTDLAGRRRAADRPRRRPPGHRRRQGHHRRVRTGTGQARPARRWRCWDGPTQPRTPELAGEPRRLEVAGVRYRYVRADVTSAAEVAGGGR